MRRRRRLPRVVRHPARPCPAYRERTCRRNCAPGPLCNELVAREREGAERHAMACAFCGGVARCDVDQDSEVTHRYVGNDGRTERVA